MKRAEPMPVEGAPVVGAPQTVVNNFITNNITKNYYNVRVKNDEEPQRWRDEKTGIPETNVAMVSWQKNSGGWLVQWVDAATKKKKTKFFKGYDAWEAAVKHRAEAQATEGKMGPGALKFTADGEAVVDCGQCRRPFSLTTYAPDPCTRKQKFATFARRYDELGSTDPRVAAAAEAALAVMPDGNGGKALRTSFCRGCRDIDHKSKMEGNSHTAACRAARDAIREDMADRGCRDCDEDRHECFECEHVDRLGKPKGCKGILKYMWFATKYKERGPEEMWKAYRSKHVVVLCKCCHALQPTHNAAMGADSSTLEGPDDKRHREYKEVKKAHNHKRKRGFVDPEWDGCGYTDPPGECYYCYFRAVEGNERAFDWMHQNDELKTCCISELAKNAQSPATAIPRIDAEIDGTNGSGGCRLGCKNCHYYHETLPRSREGTEKWDKLMATPVRKVATAAPAPPPAVNWLDNGGGTLTANLTNAYTYTLFPTPNGTLLIANLNQ